MPMDMKVPVLFKVVQSLKSAKDEMSLHKVFIL